MTIWTARQDIPIDNTKCKFKDFFEFVIYGCRTEGIYEEKDIFKRALCIYNAIVQVNILEDFCVQKFDPKHYIKNGSWRQNLSNEYFVLPNRTKINAFDIIFERYPNGQSLNANRIKADILQCDSLFQVNRYQNAKKTSIIVILGFGSFPIIKLPYKKEKDGCYEN